MAIVTTTINIRAEGPQGSGKTRVIDHFISQMMNAGSIISVTRDDESEPFAHSATVVITHCAAGASN